MMGIYKILNTVNGHFYIGMSNNIRRRFMEHKTPKNRAKNRVINRAIGKYGIASFTFSILEECLSEKDLLEREEYYIKTLNPEYNMNEGGQGNKGYSVSEKMKLILREAGKRQWANLTEEQKRLRIKNNLSGPKFPYHPSEATKDKLRQANLGKKQSLETVDKRSKSMKKAMVGNSNGNKVVLQIKEGILIKEHPSILSAANHVGVGPSQITVALKGHRNRKTSGGFTWKYKQ